jgi:hypothetical protein
VVQFLLAFQEFTMAKTATPDQQTAAKTPAAYLPFKTFLSSIEALEHGIPKKIDRTIWRNQSGVTQSQIIMALRFFRLIDNEDRPTVMLTRLVEEKDKRAEHLSVLLQVAYRDLIAHDLTKMTTKMLEDAMEQYSVTGDTKRKAVAFFLRAAKYAQIPMHPLLTAAMRNSSGPRKRRTPQGKGHFVGDMNGRADVRHEERPSGNSRTVNLPNGGSVTLTIEADPFSLIGEERKFVFDLVDKMQTYQDANPYRTAPGDEEEES